MSARRAPGAVGDQLEAEIQAEAVELLERAGWRVWQMQLGSARGGSVYCTKGIPDLYVFRKGCAAWIELKRPQDGRVRPDQQLRHHELDRAGLNVFVCYSAEECLQVMTARRRSQNA